ncbi:MAG: hypothetical protein WC052_06215 [Patescibacteria group bacterium]
MATKGKTNNPSGRPPIKHALTESLRRALSRMVDVDGKRVNGKQVLANMVADLLLTGAVVFPDGKAIQVSPKDWLDTMRWAYQYLEPPITKLEHGGVDGDPLKIVVEYANSSYPVTDIPPEPGGDST